MIRKILLLLMILSVFHALRAQNQGSVMQLTISNGTKENYAVADRPAVTVNQQSIAVANKGNTTTYNHSDVKFFFCSPNKNMQKCPNLTFFHRFGTIEHCLIVPKSHIFS